MAVTAARRENPTEDLASAIANARVDGEPLSDIDTVSYYVIVATAGHDTTSATISGGLHGAHRESRPAAPAARRPRPDAAAAEEMIRWVTPVKEFMRTAAKDTTVRGVPIAAGESVLLSYVRPTVTRTSSTTRSASTSAATPTSTWLSATACTSAWVPRWPAWRSAASSPSCCRG